MAKKTLKTEGVGSPTHVALVRGINVGGKNMLPMAELSRMFVEAGCGCVSTYIQSGNVLFSAPTAVVKKVGKVVSAQINAERGFAPAIMVRSGAEIGAASEHPFYEDGIDVGTLFVAFLAEEPAPGVVAKLDPQRSPGDRFVVRGREMFVHYAGGVLKSKLTNTYIDKTLGMQSTFRNWRTVGKLRELLG